MFMVVILYYTSKALCVTRKLGLECGETVQGTPLFDIRLHLHGGRCDSIIKIEKDCLLLRPIVSSPIMPT